MSGLAAPSAAKPVLKGDKFLIGTAISGVILCNLHLLLLCPNASVNGMLDPACEVLAASAVPWKRGQYGMQWYSRGDHAHGVLTLHVFPGCSIPELWRCQLELGSFCWPALVL